MNPLPQPDRQRPDQPGWWAVLRRQPAAFLMAVGFLTRVPVPSKLSASGEEASRLLRTSVVYFPLVGSLIGLATAGVIAGAERLWSAWLAVLLGLAFEALLTGAFHEDAVADFCDAFGGGRSREEVLRILDDSRVGSFGVLGLTLGLLLRAGAMVEIHPPLRFVAIVASATLGRWCVLPVMAWLPAVRDRPSLASDVGRRVGLRNVVVGALLAMPGVVPLALSAPVRFLVMIPVLMIALGWMVRTIDRRIGGVTGDCLGFTCYLGQVLVLLVAAARIDTLE